MALKTNQFKIYGIQQKQFYKENLQTSSYNINK